MTLNPLQQPSVWVEPLVNLGAVLLGAGLAWGTAYHFEKKKEKDGQLSVAYSLLFKVQEYANQIIKLEIQLNASLANAEAQGVTGATWTKLPNLVGFDEIPCSIGAEELALVARTRDTELVIHIRELESGYRVLKSVLDEIASLRSELETYNLDRTVTGSVVSFGVTQAMHAQVAPSLIGLQTLSDHLDNLLPRIAENARKTANNLGQKLKTYYKFKHFLLITFPERASAPLEAGDITP